MKFKLSWDRGLVILLAVTFLIGSRVSPEFIGADNVTFVLEDVTELLLIALAMAFLIITGEIDLSVASTLTLASDVIGVVVHAGHPMLLAIAAGLLTGIACGAFNGFLVTRIGLPSLAVTIGTMALYRGLCWVLLGNTPISDIPQWWTDLGSNTIPHTVFPWSFILVVVFGSTALYLLHFTRFGRWTYAIGINAQAARFSGIRVERVKFSLFLATGFMSAVAGLVYTLRFASSSPDGAMGYELSVIAACLFGGIAVAGGAGTMWGVLAAVVELGAIRSLLQLSDYSANALQVVAGGLLLASVTFPQLAALLRRRRDRLAAVRS